MNEYKSIIVAEKLESNEIGKAISNHAKNGGWKYFNHSFIKTHVSRGSQLEEYLFLLIMEREVP